MKEKFLEYAKRGAMTRKELAEVLNISERSVGNMVRAGKVPTIPRIREHRFDPMQMIETFCAVEAKKSPRSLTIEKHKTRGRLNGGYLECL